MTAFQRLRTAVTACLLIVAAGLPSADPLPAPSFEIDFGASGSASKPSPQRDARRPPASPPSRARQTRAADRRDDRPSGRGDLPIGELRQESKTPEQIALYAKVNGPLATRTSARVEYRRIGERAYRRAPDLWRVRPEFTAKHYNNPSRAVDSFAGAIFDLEPGRDYEVRVSFDDGRTRDVRTIRASTRQLPPPRGETSIRVKTERGLRKAIAAAKPGDVIQIVADIAVSKPIAINTSGTAEMPITLCGLGRDVVTVSRAKPGRIFDIQNASHWVFEDFAIRGTWYDAGLAPARVKVPGGTVKVSSPRRFVFHPAKDHVGPVRFKYTLNWADHRKTFTVDGEVRDDGRPARVGTDDRFSVPKNGQVELDLLGAGRFSLDDRPHVQKINGKELRFGTPSLAFRFWNGAPGQRGVTFRRLHISGVDRAINASGPIREALIYDNVIEGNNPWKLGFAGVRITWNDDGIRVPGRGNCVFNNTLSGFGDTMTLESGVDSVAVWFYRNLIRNSGDDAIEAEYGTRNYGFYDNHVTNTASAVSVDGVYGAPFYYFRNRTINFIRHQIKSGDAATGVLVWSNTFVTGEVVKDVSPWYWSVAAKVRDWEYRNNLVIHEGERHRFALRIDAGTRYTPWVCDHNAWARNGKPLDYDGKNFKGGVRLANRRLSPLHDNDIDLDGQAGVLAEPVVLGQSHLDEVKPFYDLALAPGSPAIGAGIRLPGISRSGDIGAYGYAETPPPIGAR